MTSRSDSSGVLIDTCVWIDFLRGRETRQTQILEILLENGDAYCCDVILVELCFGAKDRAQFRQYQKNFSEMPFLTLPKNWTTETASMGLALRKSGHRPFLADLMIAQTAIFHKTHFLTCDRDFQPFKKLFDLKILGL